MAEKGDASRLRVVPVPGEADRDSSLGAGLHNMPAPVGAFVGRAREMAELERLVRSCRLVTLTGPSGIGKTRLSLEVAAGIHGDFSGGAWLVELAPVSQPDVVPQAVASALGLDPEPGREPIDAVVDRLSTGDCLLALDNCEHLQEACALLAGRLLADCPRLRILATSQQPLSVAGEHTTSLAPLPLPQEHGQALASDAVALFCARATAGNPAFHPSEEVLPAISEICGRLDGIPLAIELAAARIVALGAADIAERLDDRFRLLTTGAPGAEPRHQSLRAALDWSYDLLAPHEATLLRRMSVFAGGATLHAVEEVCTGNGVGRREVADLVTSLVAKSLVVADTSRPRARYRLLETIRAYARDRLEEAGEVKALQASHAAWCVSVVERAWHQVAAGSERYWVTALEAEHDNVRAALEWSIGAKSGIALRLSGALTVFWTSRGYLREGQEWLRRALDALPGAPPAVRARALYGLGLLAILRGEVAVARSAMDESLAIARGGGLRRAEAQALNLAGFIAIFAQDPLTAKPVLEESVAMARADGDTSSLVSSLSLCGRADLLLGEVPAATRVFEEALGLAEKGGFSPTPAVIGLAWTAHAAGDLRRSMELFRRALTLVGEAGNRFETALVLSFLGQLEWSRGRLADAGTLLEQGRSLAVVMGAPFPLSRCLYGLAEVALAEGDIARATRLVDEACDVAAKANLPYALCRALLVRGDVRQAAGDLDGARAAFDEALLLARNNADTNGVASSLGRLARVARLREADDSAMTLLSQAIVMQAESGDGGMVASLEATAGVALDQGRALVAAGLFGAADAMRESLGFARTPTEAPGYDADMAALQAALQPLELEAAWAQGAAMSRKDAVALALRGRGTRDRPTHGWASLSPTERQIVELVADGLTNNEIGERVFISARTVQGHLSRIFAKLGVRSRRELREARRQR